MLPRGARGRVDRRENRLKRRRALVVPVVTFVSILLVGAGVAFAVNRVGKVSATPAALATPSPLPEKSLTSMDGSQSVAATGSSSATSAAVAIEVPDVTGKSRAAAETLLEVAGFRTEAKAADTIAAGVAPDTVVAQWPSAGSRAEQGDLVLLTYQPQMGTSASGQQFVVVIDAGHQAKADLSPEPIGPGSTTTKLKVQGGATGVASHVPEYHAALAIALLLRDKLQSSGVRVVMVRTTDDVNIANSQRAKIGNDAKADLVVRVHLDSAGDSAVHGVTTLYPSGNVWCKPLEQPSKRAAGLVENAVTAATGAANRGLSPRADMTGFNWSTRPTIIVECGFMSNPDEDRKTTSAAYQNLLATGMSRGVLAYLGL